MICPVYYLLYTATPQTCCNKGESPKCELPCLWQVCIEEECGRGEAVGAVWTIAGGVHDTSAVCVRDTELVRMSKTAFQVTIRACREGTINLAMKGDWVQLQSW